MTTKTLEREKADLEVWWAAAQEKKKAWEKRIKGMEKPRKPKKVPNRND